MADAPFTIEFTPESQRQFVSLVDETMKVTGRELKVVLFIAGKSLARKLFEATPEMRKNTARHVIIKDLPPEVRSHLLRAGISVEGQTSIPARKLGREFKPYTPKGRGFAKAGWIRGLQGTRAKQAVQIHFLGKGWRKAGDYVEKLKGARPRLEIANSVPYIETLNARGGTGGKAYFFQTAFGRLNREMEKRLSDFARKAFSNWR